MKRTLTLTASYLILFLCVILFLGPIVWMVYISFQPDAVAAKRLGLTMTQTANFLTNYRFIFAIRPILKIALNSLIVTVVTVLSTVILGSMTAYAITKLEFSAKNIILSLILISVMFPVYINMVPLFLIVRKLKLINTLLGAMVPHFIYGLGVFLFRQFYMGFPTDLLDSARINGYGELKIWAAIVVPLSKSAMSAVSIITFFKVYEDAIWPMIVIKNEAKMTASQMIVLFQSGTYNMNMGVSAALGVIFTIPVIILFLVTQKNFITSITMSGMKE